ncbi:MULTISPECIES: Rieske (2Fe-2S) protein [Nocardioides]|uniref:Rieske (2Fe-2S) protein n=1 Tax=Nocardioides TaxID=1839 RepID=UPI00032F78A0|nr:MULTISPECIES: Rieske (2Fe-2S) protein [Nocardioides]EON23830.1 Rieske (2Fe-2S) domain-containing protein [Nocardioides sp. CF8]
MTTGLNRRNVLGGATAAAIGLPVLAACGSDEPDSATDPTSSTPSGSERPTTGDGAESGAAALAATGDIPVGGCAVFSEHKIVVTQPTEGDFKAFTSVCTHQGCTVSASTDGVIPCGCHGSEFSIEDGSVLQGPATSPLSEVEISVDGDTITLA